MKYLLWFFAGCVCIGIPFFIGYDQHDMWNSVFGGMIGGTIFLVLLYFFVVRKELTAKWKIIIAGLFTFHILAFAAFTVTSYRMSMLQRGNLYEVRSYSIAMGMVGGGIYARGWNMLHLYYEQPAGKEKSFVDVFKTYYGEKIRNGIFFESPNALEGTYVTFHGDSVVQLVDASGDAFAQGIRSDFANINGLTGKIQYTTTMSKHGVTYERNN
ncbi:MAG: hypothetical protein HYV29_08980 [Ignavibacteriales bacterium]|nr:hypothetical protein [Ignavibacteriales bacterium]